MRINPGYEPEASRATRDVEVCLGRSTSRYNIALGARINRDPIAERGGINLYTYVLNSPVDFSDPLGLWRWPDYISLNINVAILNPYTLSLVGWSGTATLDRYGQIYFSPLGLGVGKSDTIISGSLTANWLDKCHKPTKKELDDFIGGLGFNGAAGLWGGVTQSYSPGSGWATGVGFVSPQFGASADYAIHGPPTSAQW